MKKINWEELSNSEIEVKLKEMEFEYGRIKCDVLNNLAKLEQMNVSFLNGKEILNKRINHIKFI